MFSVIRWVTVGIGLLGLAESATAQSDRRAIEFYVANFEKYLGQQISVDVASCEREDVGEYGEVAVFLIYTRGQTESGFAYAVVPKADVARFSRKYSEKKDYYRTTALRGVLTRGLRDFYISVDGAVLPTESTEQPAPTE